MNKLKVLSVIFFIIIAASAFSQQKPGGDDFAPGKIRSFAAELIDSGEYYRGYVELLRLNSYYPSYLSYTEYDITRRHIFYKSRKFSELVSLERYDNQGAIFVPSGIYHIDSLIKLDRIIEAGTELKDLYNADVSKDFLRYLDKRSAYISLLDGKMPENNVAKNIQDGLYLYSESVHNSRKNPMLGVLAGIVPGMGFVYAGETGTGLMSMFVTGTCSAITYISYREGLNSLAAVTGLITFFFYGGSIAGGYMQSERFNSRLNDSLRTKLDSELLPERDLDELYLRFGIKNR